MKILCICDKPGWWLDNITWQIIRGCEEFEWTKIYFRHHEHSQIQDYVEYNDIIWIVNWGIEKHIPKDCLIDKKIVYGIHSWKFSREHIAFAKQADAVIVPSVALYRYIRNVMGQRFGQVHLVRNGVSSFFSPKRLRVGTVAQVLGSEHKGIEIIKEACHRIGAEFVHTGFSRKGTKGETSYKLESDIPYEEMPAWYSSLDCLVVMSKSEGFGLPIVEAMAMNIPVITTDVGVAKELGCNKCKRSVSALIGKLEMLFGRNQVKDKYTWDNSAADFRKVIEAIT